MSHLISFSRYQTKRVIKFLFRQLIMSDSKIFLKSTSKAVADREKKVEEHKNVNISKMKRTSQIK